MIEDWLRRLWCWRVGHADALILPSRAVHHCMRCHRDTRSTGQPPEPWTPWHLDYLRTHGWTDTEILRTFPGMQTLMLQ